MSYPATINSIDQRVDGPSNIIYASHLNQIRTALLDIVSEFGGDLKRSKSDLATRLNVSLDANGYLVPPNNVKYVGKSGCAYSTVQSAIDAISDASADNKYIVFVYPGRYNEKITCKQYVSIIGLGLMPVEIYYDLDDGEKLITLASYVTLQNLLLRCNNSHAGVTAYGLYNSGKLSVVLKNIFQSYTTMTGDLIGLYIGGDGTVFAYDSGFYGNDEPAIKIDGLEIHLNNCTVHGGTYGVFLSGGEEECFIKAHHCIITGGTGAIDATNAQIENLIGFCGLSHAIGGNVTNDIGTPYNSVDTDWVWQDPIW
jgi:hypothetical protein